LPGLDVPGILSPAAPPIVINAGCAVKRRLTAMRRFFWIRVRMFLRRCAGGGLVMAAWFAFGTVAFHVLDGLPLSRALAVAFYVGYTPSPLWELYSFWGQSGIARARLLVLASNNIETALLVTRLARQRNPQARIIVRCYQDEFVDLLGTLGASEVISSSKSAFREIEAHLAVGP
jgi:voltage-gated potassium channel Kch